MTSGAGARLLPGLALGLALALPAAAVSQAPCAAVAGYGLGASVGSTHAPLASGDRAGGLALGVAGGGPIGRFLIGAAGDYTILEDGAARPLTMRLRLTRPVFELVGVHACASALAGGARVARGGNAAWNAAGGVAATLSRPFVAGGLRLAPYAGVRGLAAHTSGSILGEAVAVSGLSLGVEGGVAAFRGPVSGALRVTADGFDPALGATPYPDLAVRVIAGWSF